MFRYLEVRKRRGHIIFLNEAGACGSNIALQQRGTTTYVPLYLDGKFRFGLWCLMPLSTMFQFISWQSVLLVQTHNFSGNRH